MERALLITNAGAGRNDDDAVQAAVAVLRASGITVDVVATSDADELDDVLADRRGRDVVVAGGDGSLHAVVAALHARDELDQPTLGLIPLGTGKSSRSESSARRLTAESLSISGRSQPARR